MRLLAPLCALLTPGAYSLRRSQLASDSLGSAALDGEDQAHAGAAHHPVVWDPQWQKGNFLTCTYDLNTNIKKKVYAWEPWGRIGNMSKQSILDKAPRKPALWKDEDYTARKARADIEAMYQILDDLARRLDRRYWVIGGALIGALRHRSFIPWDSDGDFCMASSVDGRKIDALYGSTEHLLWQGRAGPVYGHFVSHRGGEYAVAYTRDGAQLFILSLSSGLKVEMEREKYGCDQRPDLLWPGREMSMGQSKVMLPSSPYRWLKEVDGYKGFDANALIMPINQYSACSICPFADNQRVCDDKPQTGGTEDASKDQYVFAYVNYHHGRWACTRSYAELNGCTSVPSFHPPLLVEAQDWE